MWRAESIQGAVVEIRNRFSPLKDAVNVTVGTADAIVRTLRAKSSRRRRRLRVIWNEDRQEDGVSSTDHRSRPTVRAVEHLFQALARRIGVVQPEVPMPRALPQQRWSPLIVPMMWEAKGDSPTCPVVGSTDRRPSATPRA